MTHQVCSNPDRPLHARGVSLIGAPFIIVGHNEQLGWGMSMSYADQGDTIIVELQDDVHFRYRAESQPFKLIQETIDVRGRASEKLIVRETPLGPIIKDIDLGRAMILRCVALDQNSSFEGLGQLATSTSLSELKAACSRIEAPSLVFTAADQIGNIEQFLTGLIPIRPHDGTFPLELDHYATRDNEFQPLTQPIKEEKGFIIASNHQLMANASAGRSWQPNARKDRLETLLSEAAAIDLDDISRIQQDVYYAEGFAIAKELSVFSFTDSAAVEAQEILCSWDGMMSADSAGAALVELFLFYFSEAVLRERLSRDHLEIVMGRGPNSVLRPVSDLTARWGQITLRLLRSNSSQWIVGGAARTLFIESTLGQAMTELQNRCGENAKQWRWGKLHRSQILHPFGSRPLLSPTFDLPSFEASGNSQTVNQFSTTPFDRQSPYQNRFAAAVYRQVIDCGDWSNSGFVLAPGQSGQVASPHYRDLFTIWQNGELIQPPWTMADVVEQAKAKLTLVGRPA